MWDIYGNLLQKGHCEVHPHVHEEYPCSVCMSERNQQNEPHNHLEQLQHDFDMQGDYIRQLETQRKELVAQIEQLREDSLVAFGDGFYDGYLHYAKLCGDPDFTDDAIRQSELAESDSVYGKQVGSSVRVAEIKAQAFKQGLESCIDAAIDLGYLENDAYQCAQLRQRAKGE